MTPSLETTIAELFEINWFIYSITYEHRPHPTPWRVTLYSPTDSTTRNIATGEAPTLPEAMSIAIDRISYPEEKSFETKYYLEPATKKPALADLLAGKLQAQDPIKRRI